MRQTRFIMGMPIVVEIVGGKSADLEPIFAWFEAVDRRFSPYKPDSEVGELNRGLPADKWSPELHEIMRLADDTKRLSDGYFDIEHEGTIDPSGIVKGWAIQRAAELLTAAGHHDFYVEAGGDIQVSGHNQHGKPWQIGIRNPAEREEIVKILAVTDAGVATSGTAIRGQHIYDPHRRGVHLTDILSLTVIGPNVYEADRFATAAFAMGRRGIDFIESRTDLEGYMIDRELTATMTTNFERYVA